MRQRRVADVAAFEALFASHGARMKSLALNLLGNRADAEDAVQEAFVRAYRQRSGFRSDAALFTCVCRILLNACYDIGRQRKRSGPRDVAETAAMDVESPLVDIRSAWTYAGGR